MAIPFFEPRPVENAAQPDQVDGHGGSPAPTIPQAIPTNSTNAIPPYSYPPTANGQLVAWKILALAMCKALKEYHVQSANAENAFTSGNGSLVQVLPNGQVQPVWK